MPASFHTSHLFNYIIHKKQIYLSDKLVLSVMNIHDVCKNLSDPYYQGLKGG